MRFIIYGFLIYYISTCSGTSRFLDEEDTDDD